jgi:uncharacterized membrane protein
VREYGRTARPLENLTRKGESFKWTAACQEAFEELKRRLLRAPVLAHFDPHRPTKVETDSSELVVAGVLSQETKRNLANGILYRSIPKPCMAPR